MTNFYDYKTKVIKDEDFIELSNRLDLSVTEVRKNYKIGCNTEINMMRKIINEKQTQSIKNKIASKIESGDYVTLAKVLNVKRETAVSRYIRNNHTAVLVMKDIVKKKDVLVKSLIKKYENQN